jgi:hypothetical protein
VKIRDLYADTYRTKIGIPDKIRSWRYPIAAGFRRGRSRSAKAHYRTYEKPQYTI